MISTMINLFSFSNFFNMFESLLFLENETTIFTREVESKARKILCFVYRLIWDWNQFEKITILKLLLIKAIISTRFKLKTILIYSRLNCLFFNEISIHLNLLEFILKFKNKDHFVKNFENQKREFFLELLDRDVKNSIVHKHCDIEHHAIFFVRWKVEFYFFYFTSSNHE